MAERLSAALDGPLSLPEGPVAVLRPNVGDDLSALPAPIIVTSDAVARAYWSASADLAESAEGATTVIVTLPRDKRFARALIAQACAQASELVVVNGAKTDGIDGLWREVRARVPVEGLSKAHGRVFWFAPTDQFEDWTDPGLQPGPEGFVTQPGVFSADKADAGSALLIAALPEDLRGAVADLGAGWGYLSRAILRASSVTELHVVESERRALDAARANLDDPRAHFHWADATKWAPPGALDAVVMNPPFHTGRAATPDLGAGFIANAARILAPRGSLWMVANRHLPYEAQLAERFAQVSELPGSGAFKLFHASRPRR